jgi:hypothetical protein
MSDTRFPANTLFFVIAGVGKQRRTLAVVSRERDYGGGLVRTCARIIRILSHTANRLAIQGEVTLARDTLGGNASSSSQHPGQHSQQDQWPPRISGPDHSDSVHPFPFISTCLILGVRYDNLVGLNRCTITKPLNTVYDDRNDRQAMVAIDITDIDRITYGIVWCYITVRPVFLLGHHYQDYTHSLKLPCQQLPMSVDDHVERVTECWSDWQERPEDIDLLRSLDRIEGFSLIGMHPSVMRMGHLPLY